MDRLTAKKAMELSGKAVLPMLSYLRLAHVGDLPAILALGREVFSYNPPTGREIMYFLTKAHGACWVLSDDIGVCGYILLEAHSGRKGLYLNTIAIAARARGKGLGAAIYRWLDAIAVDLRARGLYSHVRTDNAANIHLLEKSGFTLVRREDEYYDDGAASLYYKKTYR